MYYTRTAVYYRNDLVHMLCPSDYIHNRLYTVDTVG